MPTERSLPLPLILQMKAMYEERNAKGMRRYSYETLGLALGVSGTTVLRVIRGLGPYANTALIKPEPKGADAMLAELANASALKVVAQLKESGDGRETRQPDEAERGEALRKLQHGENGSGGPAASDATPVAAAIERAADEAYPDESGGKQ